MVHDIVRAETVVLGCQGGVCGRELHGPVICVPGALTTTAFAPRLFVIHSTWAF